MNIRPFFIAAAATTFALGASAQTLKPGLWDVSNKLQSSSGEMEKALAEAQKQLANMPPEQRKMMQDMMAKQGVGMGAGVGGAMTLKVCMTKEMVERNEVAAQEGDCKTTTSARMGNSMKMSVVCTKPPSNGEGQITFVSPDAYTVKMMMNSMAGGKPEKMTMDGSGKWLGSDCGSIKPLVMPKK